MNAEAALEAAHPGYYTVKLYRAVGLSPGWVQHEVTGHVEDAAGLRLFRGGRVTGRYRAGEYGMVTVFPGKAEEGGDRG